MGNIPADQAAGLRGSAALEDAGRPVRVVSVTSGKGGVGKTNIVANAAVTLARMGKKVLVMDADLGLANMDVLLGLTPDYHIGHVFSGEKRLDEIIIEGPAGIRILPAASGVQELTLLDSAQKMALLDQMDSLDEDLDILFIDTSAGIGNNVLYFNLAAQDRLVVVTPEPTSLTDAYAVIKVLSTRHQENDFRILVNMVKDEREGKEVYRKLATVADRFLSDVSLDYLGSIPYDPSIQKAVMAQKPFVDVYPDSPASKSIVEAAKEILEGDIREGVSGSIRFFWKRLFALQVPG